MKSFVIIGMGRFGRSVAEELSMLGYEVLALDKSMEQVEMIADKVTHAACCDATSMNLLRELGVQNFDCAVLAVGTDVGTSALVTLNLKELGVPQVICKAQDHVHRRVLERIGADSVIFPEHEMGAKLAQNLVGTSLVNFLELSQDYGLMELPVPRSWVGKTILQLNVRSEFKVNIIATRVTGQEDLNVTPGAAHVFGANERIVVVGGTKNINELRNL